MQESCKPENSNHLTDTISSFRFRDQSLDHPGAWAQDSRAWARAMDLERKGLWAMDLALVLEKAVAQVPVKADEVPLAFDRCGRLQLFSQIYCHIAPETTELQPPGKSLLPLCQILEFLCSRSDSPLLAQLTSMEAKQF